MWTEPIKGTRPRTGSHEARLAARDALLASDKDAAEHVMIVDLMRNDLGRVCAYGSVSAERPRVEAHAGVWHLVSTVSGRLRDGVGDNELLRASFPPGSVTGAPKVQAMKVIATLEATRREVYTGAIGIAIADRRARPERRDPDLRVCRATRSGWAPEARSSPTPTPRVSWPRRSIRRPARSPRSADTLIRSKAPRLATSIG